MVRFGVPLRSPAERPAAPGDRGTHQPSRCAMDIKSSLDRILQSKKSLGVEFYRLLFERHPHLQTHFDNVDVSRQAILLTMQLSVIQVYYTTRSPAAEKYLQVLGTKHRDWGVPMEEFPQFCETLLDALESFHEDVWNDRLREQWRDAIELATQKMFEGYDQRYSL